MTDTDGEIDALIDKHSLAIMVQRCCAAKEGSADLDKVIADLCQITWSADEEGQFAGYGIMPTRVRFTSLFEAAMTLKPAGYRLQLDEYVGDGWTVVLWPTADCPYPALGGVTNGASSATAALAITIACLRVRLAIATRPKP